MIRNRILTVGACLGAYALPAQAQIVNMVSELDAYQQGGGVMTDASGHATVVVDTQANTLSLTLVFQDLSSNQLAAHIHGPAPPGMTANIAFLIPLGSPTSAVWNYADSVEAGILAGLYYFNIHTSNFHAGELRGQITRAPVSYCACEAAVAPCGNPDSQAGCANSLGAGAVISSKGQASVVVDTLRLTATGIPAHQPGLFLMGTAQVNVPFGDGRSCVGGTTFRFPIHSSGNAGALIVGRGIATHSQANFGPAGQIDAGETFYFQCWYRDPNGPCGSSFNLSDAVEVTFTL